MDGGGGAMRGAVRDARCGGRDAGDGVRDAGSSLVIFSREHGTAKPETGSESDPNDLASLVSEIDDEADRVCPQS